MSALVKYDLGCGQRTPPGFIGVDKVKTDAVQIVHDLTVTPYTFARDGRASAIRVHHFLEHLTGEQRIALIEECHRILIPTGTLDITVPHHSNDRAIQDWDHKWPPITENAFLYFNAQWRKDSGIDHGPLRSDFDFTYAHTIDTGAVSKLAVGGDLFRHYRNVVVDLQITMTRR